MVKWKKPGNDTIKRRVKGNFVLFVGDEGAVLLYLEGDKVLRRLFSTDPEAKTSETFSELLLEHSDAPVYMLVDLVDQSYIKHTLPPVTPLGVNKIVQRRLDRDFSADDLKGAISLGREKSGRKDWNFLLVSVSYAGKIKGWCELLYARANRFLGIYLTPVESEHIMTRLQQAIDIDQASGTANAKSTGKLSQLKSKVAKKKKPGGGTADGETARWDILVLHNKTGGFRQVVLKDGKLVFTRMAEALANEKATVLAGNIEQEIRNTIEYLKRLSYRDDAFLNIMMVVGEDIKLNLSTETFGANTTQLLTPHEAASLLGLQNAVLSGDRFSDIFIACAFLQSKKRGLRLLPNYVKQTENLFKVLTGTRAVAALGSVGLIGMIGMGLYDGVMASSQLVDLEAENKQLQKRVDEFEAKAAEFEVDPFRVDSLMKINDSLSKEFPNHTLIVAAVAGQVSQEMRVLRFNWERKEEASTNNHNASQNSTVSEEQNISASVEFSFDVRRGKEEVAAALWDKTFNALQAQLPDYALEHDPIEELNNTGRGLNINFGDRGQADAGQEVRNVVTSVRIEPSSEAAKR